MKSPSVQYSLFETQSLTKEEIINLIHEMTKSSKNNFSNCRDLAIIPIKS